MPEVRQKIISCPSGHYYDANKYSSCPYCSSNSFSPTVDPFANVNEMDPTIYADGSQTVPGNDPFSPTVPPEAVDNYNDSMSNTIMIDPSNNKGSTQDLLPCVGWLVVVEGPNRGADYRIHTGYNYIGRNTGDICIKGDDTISGEKDSSITYVHQTKSFWIAHEAGKNVLLVNNIPVIGGGMELHNYDIITIGTTKLVFLGLCGEKFSWEDKERSNV